MRALKIAMGAGLSLLLAGTALAAVVTHEVIKVDVPRGWNGEAQNCADGCSAFWAFSAQHDCYVVAQPREGDAVLNPARVRIVARNPIAQNVWVSGANAVGSAFPNDSAQFVSQSVEDAGFWPIQRAEFRNGEGKTVFGALQLRTNVELWAFCLPASGQTTASTYDAIFRSIGTPTDAERQAEVEAAEAAAAPPAAPATPAPAGN